MNPQRPLRVLLMFATLVLAACASSGSAIVTGTKRAPITAELVKLYLEPPSDFEVIGLISASSDGMSEQASVDYATTELKNQAAKLGANGVLLISIGDKTSNVAGGIGKTVQGKAILVSGAR